MKLYTFLLVLISVLVLTDSTFADRRYFGRSYTSYTLPARALEFELWNTGRIGKAEGFYYRFRPRFEFEYGITDRLTTSFYFNFNQTIAEDNNFTSSPLSFSSSSLELRYRLTNPGELFIDPALYFEFGYGGDELEYEAKILLTKRMGNFIGVININSEIEREIIESKIESVFEITSGLAYELSPNIALGIEFRNHRVYEEFYGEEEAQSTFLGPTINLQTESFYITFNFLAQVQGSPSTKSGLELDEHERYEFRTILGLEL